MSAARNPTLARLLLAMTGVAGLSATAWADPRDTLRYHGDPVYIEPVVYERSEVVATITIDGECYEITECQGVRNGILEALADAGYDAWLDGYTIVVDKCHCTPRIRFQSCDYRLSVREECEELRLWVRPKHRSPYRGEIEPPVVRRDRYRIEDPAIIFDEPRGHAGKPEYRGREYGGREAREYGGREAREYGGREGREGSGGREYGGRDGRREPARYEPPSYETEYFGIGIGIDDDDNVSFDLDAGFFRDNSPTRRW